MGLCDERQATLKEEELNDTLNRERIPNSLVQDVDQGLDALQRIISMLPGTYEIVVNIEEVDDMDVEGINISLTIEENGLDDEASPDDDATCRLQMKAEIADAVEAEFDEPIPRELRRCEEEELLRGIISSYMSSQIYVGDQLASEEIAREIEELGKLVNFPTFNAADYEDDDFE